MNADFTDDSDSDCDDQRNRTWSDFSDIMDDEIEERVNKNNCVHGFLIMFGTLSLVYTYYSIMISVR